jgi:ribosomal protein S18 acetylase RimI-like enzyme
VCALFDDYRAHYGWDRSPQDVRTWLDEQIASGRMRVTAAVADGLPRGFVTTTVAPASLALGIALLVRDIWVDPAYRRRRLARHLLTHVIDTALAMGAVRIALQTELDNQPALSLYEDLGFKRIEGLRLLGLDLTASSRPDDTGPGPANRA